MAAQRGRRSQLPSSAWDRRRPARGPMRHRLRRPCQEHLACNGRGAIAGNRVRGVVAGDLAGEGHAIGSHGLAVMGCHVRGVALRLVAAGSAPASSLRREVRPPATLPATLPARPASFLSEVSCAW